MSTKYFFSLHKSLVTPSTPLKSNALKEANANFKMKSFILPFFLHFNTSNTVSTNRWPIIWNRRPCYKKAVGNSTSATCWRRNIEKKLSLGEQDFQRWILFFFSYIYIYPINLCQVYVALLGSKEFFWWKPCQKQKK